GGGDDGEGEKAGVWLARVAEPPEDALDALEKAHALNPDNQQTLAALQSYRALADAPLEEVSNPIFSQDDITVPTSSRQILLVDDSQSVRRLVTLTLEQQGYRVQSAATWHDAVELLRHGMPHLVLLDVTLPDGDGFQLCKMLAHNPDTSSVPVILLTDSAGFVSSMRGRLAGAVEVVAKSLDLDGLVLAVERYCGVTA